MKVDVCKRMQPTAEVFSLDYEGRGVARVGGKAIFIEGALPGEVVTYRMVRSKKNFDEAVVDKVVHASNWRVTPRCPYYGECGGCALQHADEYAQVAYKQRVLEEQLERIGKVRAEQIFPPIYGLPWAYRQRARLSVVRDKQGKCHVGFRARHSNRIINIASCSILPSEMSAMLPELQETLQDITQSTVVHSIGYAIGSHSSVLTVAADEPATAKQIAVMERFEARCLKKQLGHWLWEWKVGEESAGIDGHGKDGELSYGLPEFDVEIAFQSGDFTQVNDQTNAVMVGRAMRLLEPKPGEKIADLFCGLGNFALPMARLGAEVLAVEGSKALVGRAERNAARNGLAQQIEFKAANLFQADAGMVASWGKLDKLLLDPPRAGAYELVQALRGESAPKRVVYVSCNPATFARDSAVMVGNGYKFKGVGVMNLFPQTIHIESIGLFER